MWNLFGTPRGLSSSLKSKISQNEILFECEISDFKEDFTFTMGDDYGEAKSPLKSKIAYSNDLMLLEPLWGCIVGGKIFDFKKQRREYFTEQMYS